MTATHAPILPPLHLAPVRSTGGLSATRRLAAAPIRHSDFVIRHSARSGGFTLLELILALAVTCMLAAALYGSLRTAMKARDSAYAAVEPARAAQIALELIARDLESTLPPRGILEGAFAGVDGGPDIGDTLSFFTVAPGADSPDPTQNDGIKNVQLLVEPVADGTPCLIRRVTPSVTADQLPLPTDEILVRDVTRFDVQYFADEVWYPEWDSTAYQDDVPPAVHIEIEIRKPNDPPEATRRFSRTYALACSNLALSTSATTGSTGSTGSTGGTP